MIWALRISFWLQALLGLGLSRAFAGMRPLAPSGEGDLHMLVGLIGAILAIVVLRPIAARDAFSSMARFFPLLPLLVGLAIRFGGMGGVPVAIVHVLLGIAAIGLIEAAVARRKRLA